MLLTVANLSAQIADADFTAAVVAIGKQVQMHFQPEWNSTADLSPERLDLADKTAAVDGASDAIIYVGDSWQDPTTGVSNALGYHFVNHGDIPYGFIYLDICEQYQERWTCTLSHEVLELLGDPTANLTEPGPTPAGSSVTAQAVDYDLEVCDPTQGDIYTIDSIVVSNFVTRKYFGLDGTSASTNYLNLPLDPFGVRPGGYFQYDDGTNTYQVNGEHVPQSRMAGRELLGRYRRNGRRKDLLARRAKRLRRAGSNG
jgi:hypothetical protein